MRPSLALIPSAFDTGKLYSVLPEDGTGDFVVSRNGTATYFDEDGILRTAQANEPRFDFDPLTGEFKGILVEPAATNVLLNSETPATQTILMTAAQRTISFYGSGSVTLSGAFTQTITDNENPLVRTTFTFTPTATNLTITPSGNVTRWQLETGSTATSYIPTSDSQVTRPADVITRTNAQDLIGQTEGSVYVHFVYKPTGITQRISINRNSTSANNFRIYIDIIGRIGIHLNINNIGYSTPLTLTLNSNQEVKLLASWKYGEIKLVVSGADILRNTDVTNTFDESNSLNTINFHAFVSTLFWTSPIKNFTVSKRALTDQEAIALTTL